MWARIVNDIVTEKGTLLKGDVAKHYPCNEEWCILIKQTIVHFVYKKDFNSIVQGPHELILSELLECIYDIQN